MTQSFPKLAHSIKTQAKLHPHAWRDKMKKKHEAEEENKEVKIFFSYVGSLTPGIFWVGGFCSLARSPLTRKVGSFRVRPWVEKEISPSPDKTAFQGLCACVPSGLKIRFVL